MPTTIHSNPQPDQIVAAYEPSFAEMTLDLLNYTW